MQQAHRHSGQSTAEVGILIVLVALVAVLGLTVAGVDVRGIYCRVAAAFGGGGCERLLDVDLSDFEPWKVISGRWKGQNGRMCGGQGEGRIFHRDFKGDDYTITVDRAQLLKGNGYGVFFRASNVERVNGYSFQYDPGYRAFIMRKWVNGNEISQPFAVAPAPTYDWYGGDRQIQLRVKGGTFTASVDGKVLLTGRDNTYPAGGVGFRTWDSTETCLGRLTIDPLR